MKKELIETLAMALDALISAEQIIRQSDIEQAEAMRIDIERIEEVLKKAAK